MLTHSKPFLSCLIFVSKAGAYPSGSPSRCTFLDRFLALPTNIIPGWKGLPVTKAMAYLTSSSVTKKKSFITLTPGLQLSKNPSGYPRVGNLQADPRVQVNINSCGCDPGPVL